MLGSTCRWLSAKTDRLAPGEVSLREADPEREEAHLSPETKRLFARRQFRAGKRVRSAVLEIACRDMYKLYVNGHFVCRGPRRSSINGSSDTVDLAPLIRPGVNLLALDIYSMDGKPGFIAQLSLDGKTKAVSDKSFALTVPTGLDNAWMGETLDLGAFDLNWMARMPRRGETCAQAESGFSVSPLRPEEAPKAACRFVEAQRLDSGLYDLGRACAGEILAKVSGDKGARVSFQYGPDAAPFLKRHSRTDTLILGGSRAEAAFCIPVCARYICVQADPGARVEGITVRAQTALPLPECMRLETSDEALRSAFERRTDSILSVDGAGLVRRPYCECPYEHAKVLSWVSGDGRYLRFEKHILAADGADIRQQDRDSVIEDLLLALSDPAGQTGADRVRGLLASAKGQSGRIETYLRPGKRQAFADVNALAIGACLHLGLPEEQTGIQDLRAAFEAAFRTKETGLYSETPDGSEPSRAAGILAVYFGFADERVSGGISEMLDKPLEARLDIFRLKLLARLGRWEQLYSAFLDPDTADEPALAVFVEDILGIGGAGNGGKWQDRLPEEIGDVRVELTASGVRTVYERRGGEASLSAVKR